MSATNTHASVVLEQAPEQAGRGGDPRDRPSASPDWPTLCERLGETVPLLSAPAFFGPPVIFLLGPWLLLVLLLIPPAAVLITLALVALFSAGLLVVIGGLIASPYLLVRHLRARHQTARSGSAVSEVVAARRERRVKRSGRPGLIHLTTR
jgi:hypothetical protein